MVTVNFLGPIKKNSIELDVSTLKDLANELKKDESLLEWLKISAVAVNDEIVNNIDMELKDGDNISLLPPVCGG